MKVLFDFLPIIVFFAVFKWQGIYSATALSIATTALMILYLYISKKRIAPALWVNLGVITLLGGATIILHNELFIKWKPTLLYFIFASALVISESVFNINLIKKMSSEALPIKEGAYRIISNSWAIFFIIAGVLNLYVAYNFTTETWVNFKLFGLISLTLLFTVGQGIYLAKSGLTTEK